MIVSTSNSNYIVKNAPKRSAVVRPTFAKELFHVNTTIYLRGLLCLEPLLDTRTGKNLPSEREWVIRNVPQGLRPKGR